MSAVTSIAICGAAGRMGQAIVRIASRSEQYRVVGALGSERGHGIGVDVGDFIGIKSTGLCVTADIDEALDGADVVIDFSSPESTRRLLKHCQTRQLPVVVGTTGFERQDEVLFQQFAREQALVVSANFSIGVTVLQHVSQSASRLLNDFDVEIVEMHHRHKVDAPSGTALALADSVAQPRGIQQESYRYGRQGRVGARQLNEIGVMSLRGGGVVGDHTVIFASDTERVELSHRAQDRSIFAAGALRAAAWVRSQGAGRYDMFDVLGIANRSKSPCP